MPRVGSTAYYLSLNGTVVERLSFTSKVGDMSTEDLSGAFVAFEVQGSASIFYVITNGMVSNTSTSISVTGNAISPVMLAIVAHGDLLQKLREHSRVHFTSPPAFKYDSATGFVSGKYLTFYVNTTSGEIKYFNDTLENTTVFNSVTVNATGTNSTGEIMPPLPVGRPVIFGDLFLLGNQGYYYMFHDNPPVVSTFLLSNGTMNFTLGTGVSATVVQTPGISSSGYLSAQVGSSEGLAQVATNEDLEAGHYTVILTGQHFYAVMVSIGGASVTLKGSVLSFSTNSTAAIGLVAPPGLVKLPPRIIQDMDKQIGKGKLAAVVSISFANNTAENASVVFNSSLTMHVLSVSAGKVSVSVSSDHHSGVNVAIFVPSSVLNGTTSVKVLIDGHAAVLTTIGNIVNVTSNTTAYYSFEAASNGTVVIIHIPPHFSNHTVTIEPPLTSNTPPSGLPHSDYIIGGIVAVAVVAVAGALLVRRRQ